MKRVAVILPVYRNDKPEHVRLALNSVCDQTYPCTLFIGVDGPVGPELFVILNEYEQQENVCVKWFRENRGLAIVLNDLIGFAHKDHFDYIARMDADDISHPDRIEKQMRYLQVHPDVDVVGGAIEEINESGELCGKAIVYPETTEACRKFFSRRNPHAHPAVLFRYRFFEKAGLYRPEYRQNQDTMLWYDGMMAGTTHANIPDVVLCFRITNALFKKRRNGWKFAKKQLSDRLTINRELGYSINARLFAYAMFGMLVSPAWVKKIAYQIFR